MLSEGRSWVLVVSAALFVFGDSLPGLGWGGTVWAASLVTNPNSVLFLPPRGYEDSVRASHGDFSGTQ